MIAAFFLTDYIRSLVSRLQQTGEDVDLMAWAILTLAVLGIIALGVAISQRRLFPLVFKQMRQRALSTLLTLLSVALGVGMAVGMLIFQREGASLFTQTDFGYDIIVGPPKGSPLQLTLNTVYHLDVSPGVVPYELYRDMTRKTPEPGRPNYRMYVRRAVPFMVGDSFRGRRIVGTSPEMFGVDDQGKPEPHPFEYRTGKTYQLASGRFFRPRRFEAVVGSDMAEKLHLRLYDDKLSEDENENLGGAFRATHGMPAANQTPDIHKPRWHIVGILKPTHTANDRVVFVPIVSLYAIAEHEEALIDQTLMRAGVDPSRIAPDKLDEVLRSLGIDPANVPPSLRKKFRMKPAGTQPATYPAEPEAGGDLLKDVAAPAGAGHAAHAGHAHEEADPYHLDADGNIVPDLPQDEWELSAILVQSRGAIGAMQLIYNFKVIDPRATAVNPASVMRDFFNTFFKGSTLILLLVSILVTIVAGVSILVSIYNSVVARRREIAILRALGATRFRVLLLICMEAGLIGLIGGVLGLVVGHLMGFGGSVFLEQLLGQGINWMAMGEPEWIYLGSVVVLATLAGLVPALVAYRTPVATNLVVV